MKKVIEIVKPLLLVIFGALLLLIYMNYFQDGMPTFVIVIGVLGVIFGAYYIVAGIINVVLGEKVNKTLKMVFDILDVSLFPLLFFLEAINVIVNLVDYMGATAWIIQLLSIVAAIGLIILFIISRISKAQILNRFTYMSGALFALALLLDIIFEATGEPTVIGNVPMVILAINVIFTSIMFTAIGKPNQEEAPQVEEKQEEPKAE